jgi:hypothetical protein
VAKFDKDTIYIPARALERQSGEVGPELKAFAEYHAYLRNSLREIIQQTGLTGQRNPDPEIVIGTQGKIPEKETKILGGFHSSLAEQGYKFGDKLIIATLENGTDNREIYRIVNLLRAVTHDSLHSLQYILYQSLSKELRTAEEDLEKIRVKPKSTTRDLKHQQKYLKKLWARTRISDIALVQYAVFFSGIDKKLEGFKGKDFKIPFGACLFEYVTDTVARRLVRQYLDTQDITLPSPQTELEKLEYKDFNGETLQSEDGKELTKPTDQEVAKFMREYSEEITEPADYFFSLLGSYREEAERAIFLDSISGKFQNVLALGKKIKLNNYQTPEGMPLDLEEIKKFADASAVVRALFKIPETSSKEK